MLFAMVSLPCLKLVSTRVREDECWLGCSRLLLTSAVPSMHSLCCSLLALPDTLPKSDFNPCRTSLMRMCWRS